MMESRRREARVVPAATVLKEGLMFLAEVGLIMKLVTFELS